MTAPWDTLVRHLFKLYHGHALWFPEPCPKAGEPRIGDVGYFNEGNFCFLFSTCNSDDPRNTRGVPQGFEPLGSSEELDDATSYRLNAITQSQLHSKNLKSLSASTTASASMLGASISAGWQYEITEESGALMVLPRPAHKTYLNYKLRMTKYMRKHLSSWVEFANDNLGIGLDESDIVFVSGTTKTSIWAMAAFDDSSSGGQLDISFSPSPNASGSLDFHVSISRAASTSVASRMGPLDRVAAWNSGQALEKDDQTIFLNFYKMAKRSRWRGLAIMKAAADPPNSDCHPDDCRGSAASLWSSELGASSASDKSYDPLNSALKYIMEHSDAEYACASHGDLYSLFEGRDVPGDIDDALELLCPSIVIDEHGIGTITANSGGGLISVNTSDPTPASAPTHLGSTSFTTASTVTPEVSESAHKIISNPSSTTTPHAPPLTAATTGTARATPADTPAPPVPPKSSTENYTAITPLTPHMIVDHPRPPVHSRYPALSPSRIPVTTSMQESVTEYEGPETGPSVLSPGSGRYVQSHGRASMNTYEYNAGSGSQNQDQNGNIHNGVYRAASIRHPGRAVNYSDRTARPERYPRSDLPRVPKSVPDELMARRSEPDWIIPYMGRAPESGMGKEKENPHRRGPALSQATDATLVNENTVCDRVRPTLDHAIDELRKARQNANVRGWSLNVAIGVQIVLGALTTGIAATTTGRQTSIATSILGGISTLTASYLAKTRGSGEPSTSEIRARELESFIRDLQAFELDYGHVVGHQHDHMIERYRRRFEQIMGNGFEGIRDGVRFERRDAEKAKNDSPV